MSRDHVLQQRLAKRQKDNLYRQRKILQSPQGVQVVIDKKQYLSFCSNDYLGLANHPKVIAAFKRGADQYGVGGGASHLVSGHTVAHHQLEEALAAFTGRDRALVFSSGYMANLGIIAALVGKGDGIFEDKLNHASLIDGGLLSGARFQRYLHNDMSSLENYLSKFSVDNKLVVTDGVFSMDGDMAPLPELVAAAEQHNAWLMVDDAHGFGVLGKDGKGCTEYFSLSQQQLPIYMATFGKALGTGGAFVAGSEALIETLIQFARPYIYTTALPAAIAEATRTSLDLLREEAWRRESLHKNIAYFCQVAQALDIKLLPSETAIQPVLIGDNKRVIEVAQKLQAQGFLVGAIRPPTVPEGTARLRITLCTEHTAEQIDRLLNALSDILCRVVVHD